VRLAQLAGEHPLPIVATDEPVEWYFTLSAETPVTRAPGDISIPVAKVGPIAMPVVSSYPPEREGGTTPPPTHFEVLLPSSQTGWVPVNAVRPLDTDRLCYARTPTGEWKIGSIDRAESALTGRHRTSRESAPSRIGLTHGQKVSDARGKWWFAPPQLSRTRTAYIETR
jgi:hypothetical protein